MFDANTPTIPPIAPNGEPGSYWPPVQPPRPPKNHTTRNVLAICGGAVLVLIILIVSLAGGGKSTPAASTPAVSTSAPATSPAAPAPVTQTPAAAAPVVSSAPPVASSAPAAPVSSAPAAPAMTVAEQQAVEGAQGYLNLGSGFSAYSLFQQLTSSAGDGDTAADANFAISYLKPDWDAQAVEAAKSYLALGTGFSHDSLIQQLTSVDGDGFTQAQAEYAVAKVGL
jgi:hypothetical protein